MQKKHIKKFIKEAKDLAACYIGKASRKIKSTDTPECILYRKISECKVILKKNEHVTELYKDKKLEQEVLELKEKAKEISKKRILKSAQKIVKKYRETTTGLAEVVKQMRENLEKKSQRSIHH